MSPAGRILLYAMSALYVIAGVMHFVRPDFYMPMMPPYLPAHLWFVYLSGFVEIVCGVGVLVPQTRAAAAWLTIATLIAVFPANLHIAANNVPLFGATEGAGVWNWLRLPLQGLMIYWAWFYTGSGADEALGALSEFQTVFKPAVLDRMDAALQSERLAEIVRDLRDDRAASLYDIAIRYQVATDDPVEVACLRDGWLDPKDGWWKDFPALEPILRRALIRAGDAALKNKLPVESYWVVSGEHLRVAVCKGKHAIQLMILSPAPPVVAGQTWPPPAPEIVVFGADRIAKEKS